MAIRPKTEGVGDMVSAFTDTARGFGLPMSEAELAQVNALRRSCDYASVDSAIAINGTASKPPLPLPDDFRSPGIRFLKYGQNKEGYWDYDRMALQMEDVLDCVGVVYGASSAAVADAKARAPPEAEVDWSRGFATLQEMDWSSGHGRKKPDGLDAAKMNEKFGGAQPRMHSTTVSAGDIGPYEAKLTLVTPRGAKKIIDCKVRPGQVQKMVFQNRGGLEHHGHVVPPHYAPDTPKGDVDLGYQKAKRKKKRKAGADGGATAAEEEPEMEDAVTPGYVDKQKGLRQVLWERGWICPGKKYTMKGIEVCGNVDPSTSLTKIMAGCSDFLNEQTLMEDLVEGRGHEFDKSPKCHPELAGDGVEYDWGKSKHDFRAANDGVPAHLRDNIKASFAGLTRARRFLFSRKARAYKRAYLALANGEGELEASGAAPFAEIERLAKRCKTHRCALDMHRVFIVAS